MTTRPSGWLEVETPQTHPDNARRLMAAHPEIRKLIGHNPWSFLPLAGIVIVQTALAIWFGRNHTAWWILAIVAWTFGAVMHHGLWVLLHESGHMLLFGKRKWNHMAGMMSNLPLLCPAYFNFTKSHRRHHLALGEYDEDADLAANFEAKLVGNDFVRKSLWLVLFPFFQGLRPFHTPPPEYINASVLTNIAAQVVYVTGVAFVGGWGAILYLLLSLFFSIGLHPLGARWIQEHYTLDSDQETFSYYGWGNKLAFNVGYHNEHHDFPSIPWNRLPQLRRIADEHYGKLRCHRSWSRLLVDFLFDPRWTLHSRVVRPAGSSTGRVRNAGGVAAVTRR